MCGRLRHVLSLSLPPSLPPSLSLSFTHTQVRARNLKVFFATCFDSDEFEGLAKFVGRRVACAQVGQASRRAALSAPRCHAMV